MQGMDNFGFRRVRVFVVLFLVIFAVLALNFFEWWTEQSTLGSVNVDATIKKVTAATEMTTATETETQETFGQSTKQSVAKRTSKYAFFTLLAGIDPYDTLPLSRSASYLGFLLHMATVRYMLDKSGSEMDVVVLMRLAQSARSSTLPASQETFFAKLGMRIEYLPPGEDNWQSYMMEKFQLLRFYEYKQILFFDADVLPLCNWDHYFDMSERGIIAPNMVFGYRNEPAQGGFFLLSPARGDWETYQQLHFINTTLGFGETLQQPAEGTRWNFSDWTWHGAADDQGMLYHWVRFVKKDVSMVNNDRVQRWMEVNGQVKVVEELHNFSIACPNRVEVAGEVRTSAYPVVQDFLHYSGQKKPWQRVDWAPLVLDDDSKVTRDRRELWPVLLRQAWKKYDLGVVGDLIPNTDNTLNDDLKTVQTFLVGNFSIVKPDKSISGGLTEDYVPDGKETSNKRGLEQSWNLSAGGTLHQPKYRENHSQNAIFTLLAGINPFEYQTVTGRFSYLGYLLHMATVRYMLDETGSTVDFNILIRFKYGLNKTLPESQRTFFKKLKMNIEYLSQQEDDSWRSFMMEKFQILRYQEYSQILFVDADVLPLCNWDHYFNMSERGIFAPNLAFAYHNEPAQGGFFLLSPDPGDWEKYVSIPGFINFSVGFGVPLAQPAESLRRNFTEWNWHGSKDDQGMLYHWLRYVKKNVTLVNGDRLQKWVEVDGKVAMVDEVHNFNIPCPNSINFRHATAPNNSVIRDFVLFTGRKKAWQMVNWTSATEASGVNMTKFELWASTLRKAWHRYDLGPVRHLVPNISGSFEEEIAVIESFLNQTVGNE